MLLEKDCCVHPSGSEIIERRYLTETGVLIEVCKCPACGHKWERWAGAGGEDV